MRIESVVVNASPLICLCKSGLSEILPALFTGIIVPAAVHKEITPKEDISRACRPFFAHQHVKIVSDIVIPSAVISWDLGEGESAVLSHALNHSEYWAVIDDRGAENVLQPLAVAVPELPVLSSLQREEESSLSKRLPHKASKCGAVAISRFCKRNLS